MLNVVVLMGRIVADPELRHTPNDVAVTGFRIAVDRAYSKGQDKQADFIDITAWRQTAEFVCRYFTKGSMIAVKGSLRVDNYTDRDGNKRTRYDVQAKRILQQVVEQFTQWRPPCKTSPSDRKTKQVMKE